MKPFTLKDDQILGQVALRVCGCSILGDIQNLLVKFLKNLLYSD